MWGREARWARGRSARLAMHLNRPGRGACDIGHGFESGILCGCRERIKAPQEPRASMNEVVSKKNKKTSDLMTGFTRCEGWK